MTNRQAYVSDKLTHFTGRSLTTDPDRYSLLVQIIESGILKPDADFPDQVVGSGVTDVGGALCDDTAYMADVVCFCDIPASDYHIHMSKYSHFGLGFDKRFLIRQGANPVFYVAKNSWVPRPAFAESGRVARCQEFDAFWRANRTLRNRLWGPGIPNEVRVLLERASIFEDFNVYSFIKFFDDGLPEDHKDNYYMEREWRTRGVVRFSPSDIATVVLPEVFRKQFCRLYPQLGQRLHLV